MKRSAAASDRDERSPWKRRDSERERDTGRVRDGPASVAALHQSVGNQAVQELHERGDLQAKLAVSQPTDASEREADRVADAVLSTSDPEAIDDDETEIQRDAGGSEVTTVGGEAEERIRSVQGGGSPLPDSTRSFFESRFGRDFSEVRVHTGPRADEAARSINAEAFTMGSDIAFARGNYQPTTRRGRELLAHELTHVVQQGASTPKAADAPDRSGGHDGPSLHRRPDAGSVQRQAATDTSTDQKLTVGTEVRIQNGSRATFDGTPGVVAQIFFPTGVATLDEGDERALKELDDQIRQHSTAFVGFESFRFRAKGYADGRGEKDENKVLATQRAAAVANRFRSLETFSFLRNANGFDGVEYETLGEEGPQTGDASELARYRRVDLVLEATERSTGGSESEDKPTGKPPTPETYETVEGRDPGTTNQPEGGVPDHVKPSQFDQWITMFSDAKWWADAGLSIVGPWLATGGLISTISAASSIVLGMPLSIYTGLRALGRAQSSDEEADAIMGASYGFTAAVMNPSAPRIPSAPDDVSATHFRSGAIEEAERVRSKIQDLEERVKSDPDDTEAAKQLAAFYKLYEGGQKGAEEILNETYRQNLKEHLPPRAATLHADRHLTWPTPTTRDPMKFAMPDDSGQGTSGQGTSGQGTSGQGTSGQGTSGQGTSGQGETGQTQ